MRNRTLLPGGGSPGLIGVESWRPAAPPAPPGTFELNPIALGSLSPIQGRFAQADPHATALPVMRELPFHGGTFSPKVDQFDLEARFTDGANLYQYLRSGPYGGTDPAGLWMWGGWADTLTKGTEVALLAVLATDTYQFVMTELAEWATNWSRSDEDIDPLVDMATLLSSRDTQDEFTATADVWGPAVASAGGPLGRSVLRQAARSKGLAKKVQDQFNDWLTRNNATGYSVYIAKRGGKTVYVGITNNMARRRDQHGGRFDYMVEIAKGLTRGQARCVEQVIIEANEGMFDNKINSISPTRLFIRLARRHGNQLLAERGINKYFP